MLPAPPTVDEAVDGYLDMDFVGPATVRVGAYPGMAANDVVTVHWVTWSHRWESQLRIPGSRVGGAVTVLIPNLYVTGSATWVSYAVDRFGGGGARSGVLALNGADSGGPRL
ncbi:hypothetical protein [Streptomyces sp. MZ04]|uniref:hypothetical protein n=1 Tax=Streptomyces sp. MZ04 TaxID=2559236 RepID=UPI00107EA4FC|nr:hypothetical protein [Streptomyces sp. MZ04]TGB10310.1 hypothetical protein E2651_14880 [Streptomyces sp. MZ04]